jgi:hypothetical protein
MVLSNYAINYSILKKLEINKESIARAPFDQKKNFERNPQNFQTVDIAMVSLIVQ